MEFNITLHLFFINDNILKCSLSMGSSKDFV